MLLYNLVYLGKSFTVNTMTHCQQRLAERNLEIAEEALWKIARFVGNAAVLLARLDNHVGQEGAYRGREESNGDLVVLIVRDSKPVTIMYRRSDQPFTTEAMRVNQVYEI